MEDAWLDDAPDLVDAPLPPDGMLLPDDEAFWPLGELLLEMTWPDELAACVAPGWQRPSAHSWFAAHSSVRLQGV